MSARQRAQEGVFTRLSHPIFADLEQYLRNKIGESPSRDCLVKIEIRRSAIPALLRELEQRGIDEVSLGSRIENDNPSLDQIAGSLPQRGLDDSASKAGCARGTQGRS